MSETLKKEQRLENVQATEDGLSYAEIAKILDIPVKQVKKIEREALRKLKAPSYRNKILHKYWGIGLRPEDTDVMRGE